MEVLLPTLPIARIKQSGQSLIELVAALTIIMIVLLALAGAGLMSIRNSDLAKNKALATKYAQEGMEKVRAYRDQNGWTVFSGACDTLGTSLALPALPAPLTRAITCDDTIATKLKVIVTVSWIDSKNISHNSQLVTYFTNQSSW